VKINKNFKGHLVGDASLVSDCLDSPRLEVTVNGSNVVLEGSDAAGDGVSFRGTVDNTGTELNLNYIINGSPSGRCEIDNGTGSMCGAVFRVLPNQSEGLGTSYEFEVISEHQRLCSSLSSGAPKPNP